jgi:uncharacterized glyoxalase superfamily protein PhnB
MNATTKTDSTIIPALRYRNAPAAIDWLCRVFGFEKHQVCEGSDSTIVHAELTLNGGMVMLGSVGTNSEYSKNIKQPDEIGGFETQSSYIVVSDADAVYVRAVAVQAEIVIAIKDEDYGGRGFTCRDLEGRLWSVGTYDPWKQKIS